MNNDSVRPAAAPPSRYCGPHALREVSIGRSALPNIAQAEQDNAPSNRLSMTWMVMFQGKLAIPDRR